MQNGYSSIEEELSEYDDQQRRLTQQQLESSIYWSLFQQLKEQLEHLASFDAASASANENTESEKSYMSLEPALLEDLALVGTGRSVTHHQNELHYLNGLLIRLRHNAHQRVLNETHVLGDPAFTTPIPTPGASVIMAKPNPTVVPSAGPSTQEVIARLFEVEQFVATQLDTMRKLDSLMTGTTSTQFDDSTTWSTSPSAFANSRATWEADMQNLVSGMQQLIQTLKQSKSNELQLEQERNQATSELSSSETIRLAIQRKLDDANAEILRLGNVLDGVQVTEQKLTTQLRTLTHNVDAAETALTSARQNMLAKETELSISRDATREQQQMAENARAEVLQQQQYVVTLQSQLTRVNTDLVDVQRNLSATQKKLHDTVEKQALLQTQLTEATDKLAAKEMEIAIQTQRLATQDDQLREFQVELTARSQELASYQSTLHQERRKASNFQRELQVAQTQLVKERRQLRLETKEVSRLSSVMSSNRKILLEEEEKKLTEKSAALEQAQKLLEQRNEEIEQMQQFAKQQELRIQEGVVALTEEKKILASQLMELNATKEQLKIAQEALTTSRKEASDLHTILLQKSQELTTSERAHHKTAQELEQTQENAALLQTLVQTTEQNIQELREHVITANKQVKAKEAELASVERNLVHVRAQYTNQKDAYDLLERVSASESSSLNALLSSTTSALDKATKDLDDRRKRLKAAVDSARTVQDALQTTRTQLAEITNKLSKEEAFTTNLRKEVDTQKALVAASDMSLKTIREELDIVHISVDRLYVLLTQTMFVYERKSVLYVALVLDDQDLSGNETAKSFYLKRRNATTSAATQNALPGLTMGRLDITERSCAIPPTEDNLKTAIVDTRNTLQLYDDNRNHRVFPYDTVFAQGCWANMPGVEGAAVFLTPWLTQILKLQEQTSLKRDIVIVVPANCEQDLNDSRALLWSSVGDLSLAQRAQLSVGQQLFSQQFLTEGIAVQHFPRNETRTSVTMIVFHTNFKYWLKPSSNDVTSVTAISKHIETAQEVDSFTAHLRSWIAWNSQFDDEVSLYPLDEKYNPHVNDENLQSVIGTRCLPFSDKNRPMLVMLPVYSMYGRSSTIRESVTTLSSARTHVARCWQKADWIWNLQMQGCHLIDARNWLRQELKRIKSETRKDILSHQLRDDIFMNRFTGTLQNGTYTGKMSWYVSDLPDGVAVSIAKQAAQASRERLAQLESESFPVEAFAKYVEIYRDLFGDENTSEQQSIITEQMVTVAVKEALETLHWPKSRILPIATLFNKQLMDELKSSMERRTSIATLEKSVASGGKLPSSSSGYKALNGLRNNLIAQTTSRAIRKQNRLTHLKAIAEKLASTASDAVADIQAAAENAVENMISSDPNMISSDDEESSDYREVLIAMYVKMQTQQQEQMEEDLDFFTRFESYAAKLAQVHKDVQNLSDNAVKSLPQLLEPSDGSGRAQIMTLLQQANDVRKKHAEFTQEIAAALGRPRGRVQTAAKSSMDSGIKAMGNSISTFCELLQTMSDADDISNRRITTLRTALGALASETEDQLREQILELKSYKISATTVEIDLANRWEYPERKTFKTVEDATKHLLDLETICASDSQAVDGIMQKKFKLNVQNQNWRSIKLQLRRVFVILHTLPIVNDGQVGFIRRAASSMIFGVGSWLWRSAADGSQQRVEVWWDRIVSAWVGSPDALKPAVLVDLTNAFKENNVSQLVLPFFLPIIVRTQVNFSTLAPDDSSFVRTRETSPNSR